MDNAAKPASKAVGDPVARSLIGALVAGLVLLMPVRLAMAATTDGGRFGWVVGGLVAALLIGLILRDLGVPHAIGLALTTTAILMVAALIGLMVAAKAGAVSDSDGTVALLVGIPAAAVAAPLAVRALRSSREPAVFGSLSCVGAFAIIVSFAGTAFDMVDDARVDAKEIAEYESAGLTAYLPAIPELLGTYDGQRAEVGDGERTVVGYDLDYDLEEVASPAAPVIRSSVSVEVSRAVGNACEPDRDYVECVEGDGYVVAVLHGVEESVSADLADMRLTARLSRYNGELPDVDTIGAALADAEEVDWGTLVDLD